MIWSCRIDHMEGNMTPLTDMPSLLVRYLRELLVWSYIKRPAETVMLWIRKKKNHSNMITQRNFRGALKVWRLIKL